MAKSSGTRAKGEDSIYQEKSGRWAGSIEIGYVDGKRRRKRVFAETRAEVTRKLRTLRREMDDVMLQPGRTITLWVPNPVVGGA
jgi:integrase